METIGFALSVALRPENLLFAFIGCVIIASVIKTAETLVDLSKMGIKRSRKEVSSHATKEELMAARQLYKIE